MLSHTNTTVLYWGFRLTYLGLSKSIVKAWEPYLELNYRLWGIVGIILLLYYLERVVLIRSLTKCWAIFTFMPVCFSGMSLLEWSDWWGHGVGESVEPFLVATRGHHLPESRPLAAGRPPLVVMDWTTTPLPCTVLDKEEGQGGQSTQSQHEADHEGDNPTLSNQN